MDYTYFSEKMGGEGSYSPPQPPCFLRQWMNPYFNEGKACDSHRPSTTPCTVESHTMTII